LLGEVPAITIDAAFSTLVTDHYAFKKSYRTPVQQLGVIKAIATRMKLTHMHQLEKANLNQLVLTLKRRVVNGEISPGTVNAHLRVLRHAINYTRAQGYRVGAVTKDTWQDHFYPTSKPRTKFYTEDEFARLLAELPEHLVSLVLVAVQTGLRAGNLLNLTEDDIDFERDEITVYTKSADPNGNEVTIGIGASLRAYLLDLCAKNRTRTNEYRHLFLYRDRVTRMYRPFKNYKTAFNRAKKRAGLGDCTFHDLRHTCASWLLAQGYDLIDVKEQLGHSSVVTTQKYTHTTPERKRDRTEAISHIIRHTDTDDSVQPIVNKRKQRR